MTSDRPDLGRLMASVGAAEVLAWGGQPARSLLARLGRATLVEERRERRIVDARGPLGRVLPHGSVVLEHAGAAGTPARRIIELDRHAHLLAVVRRDPGGVFAGATLPLGEAGPVAILPGGARHAPWGPSDRIVRVLGERHELLTLSGGLDWDAIRAIPPVAEPARLPAGGGSAILNLLAGLAADQGAPALRYAGPYATEQLFWTLLQSFRVDPAAEDPLGAFLEDAEEALARGRVRSVPVDWLPAPHERLVAAPELLVSLRDGVEKITWRRRPYHREAEHGLRRRHHRVVRRTVEPGGRASFTASLTALGAPIEDHLVLDPEGELLAGPFDAVPEPASDAPLAAPWREALATLVPLEASPLLGSAIRAAWPGLTLVWGPVPWDLVEVAGSTVRFAHRLAVAYEAARARQPSGARRAVARQLVRDVLGLVGPAAREAAARWLDAQPPDRREAALRAGAAESREAAARRATAPLGRLLALLEAGQALPRQAARTPRHPAPPIVGRGPG